MRYFLVHFLLLLQLGSFCWIESYFFLIGKIKAEGSPEANYWFSILHQSQYFGLVRSWCPSKIYSSWAFYFCWLSYLTGSIQGLLFNARFVCGVSILGRRESLSQSKYLVGRHLMVTREFSSMLIKSVCWLFTRPSWRFMMLQRWIAFGR